MLLVDTKLSISDVHGIGLFAAEEIPKGTVIWEYHPSTCQVFTPLEFYKLCCNLPLIAIKNFLSYSYYRDHSIYYINDNTRFINHSLHPNVQLVDNYTEIAIRDIHIGEEISENYHDLYDDNDFFNFNYLFDCTDENSLRGLVRDICVNH